MAEHRSNASSTSAAGSSYTAPPQHPQNDPHLRKMYRSLFAHSPTSGMPVMVPASPLHHAAYRLESPVDLHQQYMRQQQQQQQQQNRHSTVATGATGHQTQQQQQGEEETSGQERPQRRRGRTQLILQPLRRRYQKAMQQQDNEQEDNRTEEGFVPGPLDMDSEIGSTRVQGRDHQESNILEESSGASAVATNPKQSDGIMDAAMSPTFTTARRHSIAGSTPVTPSTLFGFHHMKFHESPTFSPLPISGRYYSPVSPLPISSPPGTIKSTSSSSSSSANAVPGFFHRPVTAAHPYAPQHHQRSPQHPFVMYPYPSFATSPYSYYPYPAPPYHTTSPYIQGGGYPTSVRANNSSNNSGGSGRNPTSVSSQPSQGTSTAAAAAAGGVNESIEAPTADTTGVPATGKTRKPRTREPHARPSHPGQCGNCGSTDTPMWRRSRFNKGVILCNKCGLYEARTGRDRPMLKRKPIKRRKASTVPQPDSELNSSNSAVQQKMQPQSQPLQQLNPVANIASLPPPAPSLTQVANAQEGETAVPESQMKDTSGTAPVGTSQEAPETLTSLTDAAKLMLQDQDQPHGPQQQKLEPTVTSTQDHHVPSSHS